MQRFQEGGPDAQDSVVTASQRDRRATLVASLATLAVMLASPAIAVSTGDGTWYALPLFVGLLAFWRRGRLSRRELGFRSGRGFYRPAIMHPLLVVGCAVAVATALSSLRVRDVGLGSLLLQATSMIVVSFVGTLVAEDGFFRGALWGALERAGRSTDAILLWTSTANAVWFLPLLWIEPGFATAPEAMAVHVLNVWLLGMCWGVLRLASGSVLAAAWGHAVWNGLTYTLYGFGPAVGALNVLDPSRFDP
ncbi:MAG: CPBP family intramembrane metalloprotease, partial [Gemmatimonadetes bacterium]|nr:CPBP family intramembrane metalloprotease [Gemmatimonadota bacterium]